MACRQGGTVFVLTYNGELYNTSELRDELEQKGHIFRSRSDTEVLLHAYMEWREACPGKLNGIFAFAVWDTKEEALFIARDRMGVKPLFYAFCGSLFLFGSEQKAILAHPCMRPAVGEEGLLEIFMLGPTHTPGSGVFKGIMELRPGYCAKYNRRGLRLSRYWRLESRIHKDGLTETAAHVRELFCDAVKRQLVSDVPLGALLSGGLDSSAITAVASRFCELEGKGDLSTFSVDFYDNDRYFRPDLFQPESDLPYIKRVSERFGTVHHDVTLDVDLTADALIEAVRARDLPGMADIDSSLYLFCREIKKKVTVGLSGESADEIFGGYPWFHHPEMAGAVSFPWSRRLRERIKLLAPGIREKVHPEEYVSQRYSDSLMETPRLSGEDAAEDRRRELFYLNITWFLAALLERKDRMSMASGLEIRVPFCDHRLVEYVWNIPWRMKTYGGLSKGILRLAFSDVLPQEVLLRKKSPYPKTHHPGYLQAVRARLQAVLDHPASPLLQVVDRKAARDLILSEDNGNGVSQPWFGQLMTGPQFLAYLLQIHYWLDEYHVAIEI